MTTRNHSSTIPSEQPVFLFASGHRCGSTLIQRLLNSHCDILIWGEQNGYLSQFLRGYESLLRWESNHSRELETFLSEGYDQFLPNMVPQAQALKDSARNHILWLFGVPAARLCRTVWGFKEVRYSVKMALFLQDCFPGARFIHLTRNVIDCFISMKYWEDSPDPWNRKWTESSIRHWQEINASFLSTGQEINRLLKVKYEDMIDNPDAFTRNLSQFLEIADESLDQNVFHRRLDGAGSPGRGDRSKRKAPSDLNTEERALLSSTSIVRTAEEYGYKITF